MRDTKVDMLHGPLAGKLFWFALPIAASSMLQQLFNAADTAVVGKFAEPRHWRRWAPTERSWRLS